MIPSERVGFYGKNAIIQHLDYGSWISLLGFVTDAELEPDDPLDQACGKCELCLTVCPTSAIFAPYRCEVTKCRDFHLGHNKGNILLEMREKSSNLMGEGCTVCRDICPKNRKLKSPSPPVMTNPSMVRLQ